ncbi:SGNH/GDSL hydrolase family protein [Burkholderia plantarii]|uniref:SGNH/GDSL hydrolase family protein n=1 Tax=Burkholderia plantarii TaxID=41899 RepID=UPI0018DD775E|nr:SGNH/GDSL hydrolase family protein [Burkholderia plantarii]MBI0331081.1 lipase [Burkholderia plantarii]
MTNAMPAWIDAPIRDALVRGAFELEPTEHGVVLHRLPAWARAQCADPQLTMVEAQPSGVRLVFRTRATRLELDTLPTHYRYAGAPARPLGVYDLLVDGRLFAQASADGGERVVIDLGSGAATREAGAPATLRFTGLPAHHKRVEIWLPHNEATRLVALRADAAIEAIDARDDGARRVWLHHGSSISQGSNAASPTGIWPALAAAAGGVELVNLGFGGSALLDPFVARTIRDARADLISLKLGINLVNADLMRLRALAPAVHGFLDTIRDGHPDTPLLVVSPIHCAIHEDTPGPGAFDLTALAAGRVSFRATGDPAERAAGKLTLRVVRDVLRQVVQQRAAGDARLFHLDGLELYGRDDFAELPLPDQLHPDGAAHRRIAERFAARVFARGGAFSAFSA